ADEMEKIDGLIAGVYAQKTGRESAEFEVYMDAETWFTAEEAVAAGLADEIEAQKHVAASLDGNFLAVNGQKFDLSRYKDTTKPKQIAPDSADLPEGSFFMPDNGGESQPVTDSNTALETQRRRFNDLRKKLLEV
ncbi:MAG: ATP-dependent Clp protease proteolytic subunit, partial [Christensenellales bacterium]